MHVWTERLLHSFVPFSNDGISPAAGVILDKRGNLYGTAAGGGHPYVLVGTIFEITP
jgi:hypothetical protein